MDAATEALLTTIASGRDDDATRLVWGDAVGGERGELVMLQCALAAGGLTEERRRVLAHREAELLHAHARRWAGLEETTARVCYRRGFVEALEADAQVLLARSGRVRALAPLLRRVTLTGLTRRSEVTGAVTGPSDPPRLVERLVHTELAARLEGLEVQHAGEWWERESEFNSTGFTGLGDEVAEVLARSGVLGRLTALGVNDSRIGPAGARALGQGDLSKLERLWLAGQVLGDDAALELLAPGRLPRLRSLKLSGVADTRSPHVTARLAPALPAGLVELYLDGNFLRDGALAALAESKAAPTVEHLALGHGWYSATGLQHLERFAACTRLDLDGGSLGSAGHAATRREAVLVLATLRLPALRELRLTACSIDEPAVELLADGIGSGLEVLDLRDNPGLETAPESLRRRLGRCQALVGPSQPAHRSMFQP